MYSKTEQNTEPRLAGTSLRRERERQGLRVEDIASLASIPLQTVRSIEANRFDDLQSPAQAWESVTSYARVLGCDSEPWLEQLQEVMPQVRSTRMLRRGRDLLDNRRAILRQRFVAMAVVAVLWLLYTFLVNMVSGTRDKDVRTDSDVPAVEQTLGEMPAANH